MHLRSALAWYAAGSYVVVEAIILSHGQYRRSQADMHDKEDRGKPPVLSSRLLRAYVPLRFSPSESVSDGHPVRLTPPLRQHTYSCTSASSCGCGASPIRLSISAQISSFPCFVSAENGIRIPSFSIPSP